ncbi:syx-3 [Pristionchus pacificus]|uniref:Syx-3 n=1 Tax=Pristionchus pacificus TaxID=54126 RepID=A0A454XQJ9_PRIPA|nr:syx-3 [Pristionchus pacificus]|eukprot:PDM63773.1 syx-3 [Pristionchus pacificus]
MVKDRLAEISFEHQKRGRGRSTDSDECDPEKEKMLTTENWNELEQFHEEVERFKTDMDTLEREVKDIHVLHGRILSQPPNAALTNEMNRKTDDAHRQLRQLMEHIRTLDKNLESAKDKTATVSNRINREQVKRLIRSLVNLTEKFNKGQVEYKEKSRKKCVEYLRVMDQDLPDDVIDEAIKEGTLSDKIRGVILAVDEKKALLDAVKQRTEDIQSLEKSIRDLAEMFHDLHLLVVSQDEMLENIERNIERSVEYAFKAKDDIVSAQKMKRRAQMMKIGIIIGVIILVILLFLVGKMLFCFYLPFLC